MSNTRSHKVKLIGTQRWHHEVVDLGGQNDRDNSPAVNSSLVMLIILQPVRGADPTQRLFMQNTDWIFASPPVISKSERLREFPDFPGVRVEG